MTPIDTNFNMTTFSGLYLDPFKIKPEDIRIQDIAHGLSNICRFGGQCKEFYSVAQHSVYVAEMCSGGLWEKRVALLHDAPEAYAGDVIKCIKLGLGVGYENLEAGIWKAVCERFGLGDHLLPLPSSVISADNRVLINERKELISDQSAVWSVETEWDHYPQLHIEGGWDPSVAKRVFLEKFQALFPTESIL